MDPITLVREFLKQANDYLEMTMADVTPEQAHWTPPGVANPLGASYAHVVMSQDMVVNGMLRGQAPLFVSTWAGRTGASEPMPMPGPEWTNYGPWTRSVQVDLPAMREYAQAVYAASDDYLASLTPEDLDRPMDLSSLGVGQVNLAWALHMLLIGHVNNIHGEISCLKGLQGAKGYPF